MDFSINVSLVSWKDEKTYSELHSYSFKEFMKPFKYIRIQLTVENHDKSRKNAYEFILERLHVIIKAGK